MLTTREHDQLESAVRVAQRAVRKEHALLRMALLAGFFGEIEQASFDTFTVNDQGFRFELRPTVQVQPFAKFSVRADWYLKYAFRGFAKPEPAFRDQIQRAFEPFTSLWRDLRTELILAARLEVHGVAVEWSYTRLKDYLPPFAQRDGRVVTTSDGRPITAAWRRSSTTFKVVIPLQ